MAGALGDPRATQFTSLAIGSGHSLGGGDYASGSTVLAIKYITVAPSVATVVASGVSTQTFTATGFGLSDWCDASFVTALPQGVFAQVWLSAASQGSIAFSNTSGATTAVSGATFILQLVKLAP